MVNPIKHFDVIEHLIELTEQERLKSKKLLKKCKKISANLEKIEAGFNKVLNNENCSAEAQAAYTTAIELGLGKFINTIDIIGIAEVIDLLLIYVSYLDFLFENCAEVKNIEYITKNITGNFSFLRSDNDITLTKVQEAHYNEQRSPVDIFLQEFSDNAQIAFTSLPPKNKDLLLYSYGELQVYADAYCVKTIRVNEKTAEFEEQNSKFFVDFWFRVDDRNKKVSDLFYPVYAIVGAFEQIDGVTSTIKDIRKGSLIARIFLWVEELFAKEEIKSTLQNVQQLLANEKETYLNKTIAELKEQLIKEKNWYQPSSSYEVTLKKMKLAEKKLTMIKKVSELVTHTVLSSDDLTLYINNVEFVRVEDGKIYINPINIDEITE